MDSGLSSGWVAGIIVPVAVAFVLGFARRYLRPPAHPRLQLTEASRSEFQRIAHIANFATCAVMPLFAFTTYKLLLTINQHFADAGGPAQFQLLPSRDIWMFFPGFGALALSWEITLKIWSLFAGRKKVEEFEVWAATRAGLDSTKMLRWLALLVALPIGVATILALPMHSALYDWGISVRSYASVTPIRLPYADARRLTVVHGFRDRDGKFTRRAEILIDFANGYRWHSEANRDFERSINPDMLKFLEQKTGLPAEEVETERDLAAI
jgi:hypothetical protein